MNNIRSSFLSNEARQNKTIFELLDEIYMFMIKHMSELGPKDIKEPFNKQNGYFDVQIFGGYAMYQNLLLLASPDGLPFILHRLTEPINNQIQALEAKIAKFEEGLKGGDNNKTPETKSKLRRLGKLHGNAKEELSKLKEMLPTLETAQAIQDRYANLLYLFIQSSVITTNDIDFKVFTKHNILSSKKPLILQVIKEIKPGMEEYFRTIMVDTLHAVSGDISFNDNRHGRYYKFLKAGAVDIAFMTDHKIPALELYERFFTSIDSHTPFNGTYPGITDTTIPISTHEDSGIYPVVPGVAAIPLMWANQTHLAVLAIAGVICGKYTNKNKSISKVIGRLLMANAMYYPAYDYHVVGDYLGFIDWMNTFRGLDNVMSISVSRKATNNNKQSAASLARELLGRYVDMLIVSPEQSRLVELIIDEDAEFRRDLALSDVEIARVKGVLMLSRFDSPVHVAKNNTIHPLTGGRVDTFSPPHKISKPGSSQRRKTMKANTKNKKEKSCFEYEGEFRAFDEDMPSPADKFIMHELRAYRTPSGHR